MSAVVRLPGSWDGRIGGLLPARDAIAADRILRERGGSFDGALRCRDLVPILTAQQVVVLLARRPSLARG